MKLILHLSTVGGYGGPLSENLRHLDRYISQELEKAGFSTVFDYFELCLFYPPMYVLEGIKGMEVNFNSYYARLPFSRIDRKNKQIAVSLQAPEFSEHIQSEKAKGQKYQFEIELKYKNLDEVFLANVLLDKYIDAAKLLQVKLKGGDSFDTEVFISVINSVKNQITPQFLERVKEEQMAKIRQDGIQRALEKRENRRQLNLPKDKLIRDIRVYSDGDKLNKALNPYAYRYAQILLNKLYNNGFMCPGYHHLYIQVAETTDAALLRSSNIEPWYICGIATINYDSYIKLSEQEKEKAVFDLIIEGLKDIAVIDKLDMDILNRTIDEIRQKGLDTELFYKTAENKKYHLQISYKMNPAEKGYPVFFTLTDKLTGEKKRKAVMYFENSYLFVDRLHYTFQKISVTNKEIKIKSSSSVAADVYLKGLPRELVFNIDDL